MVCVEILDEMDHDGLNDKHKTSSENMLSAVNVLIMFCAQEPVTCCVGSSLAKRYIQH